MPLVQISLVQGRDEATTLALIREVTDAVARATGVGRERVRVILYEVPAAAWGVGGVTKADRA